ncbi:MAG: 30S ribosomal protein S1 [Deltaproteobacteria bacterium RBG_16_66_15]|nr:MAG: 30S ribosomal protein S1 [Deltaproteobacteria bacterium GWA2_65_63]OGP26148.1 MAG: 30S ribosomal protein S1 [Deltaproteobacteria bacterium GWB2_65_81]OGP38600.1 MAG: 30S ribosomal protein S1 [Deltaproteobacteria bacterium GWC2_66_88]OGP78882.1 MAG: 30S ribosomal protein S1 [Deltaproteobacteria bacterium RBG_16_66_15]HAM32542.1 30S ribosomal protein S1 [Deltaproteobacteria bacterium]
MEPDEEKKGTREEPEEESFGELLDKSFVPPTRYEPGQKVAARVIKVTPDWVFLDMGRKGEGVLAAKELVDDAGTVGVKEGDTLAAYFVSSDGSEMLFTTRIAGGAAGAAQLEEAARSGIPVDGLVVKAIKGGYEVRLAGGARAFCPHSQMGLARSGGPEEHVGKHAPFRITKYGEKGRNIVVSSRVLLEEEEERKAREVMATLAEGMVVKGTVTAVREFGAFVSIGPIEGLIPVSEIGWERVEDVESVLSVGQEVEVAITRLDRANKRFSFSLKKTLADPWETASDRFPAGSHHVGKVARLTAFGAFVSLGGGVDGLLHVSKLGGGKRIRSAGEVLRTGQEIEVKVDSVDSAKRRVALSLAAAESRGTPEEEAEDYSKYIDPSPAPPALGALGEALKASLERKKK